jgi:hypothetical protein
MFVSIEVDSSEPTVFDGLSVDAGSVVVQLAAIADMQKMAGKQSLRPAAPLSENWLCN